MPKQPNANDDSPVTDKITNDNKRPVPFGRDDPFANIVRLTEPKDNDRSLSAMDELIRSIDSFLLEKGLYSAELRKVFSESIARAIRDSITPPSPIDDSRLKPLYKNRNFSPDYPELKNSNIEVFLRVVWGREIAARTLTLPALRAVDPEAASMASVWKTRGKLPPDIYLPTQQELNDAALGTPRPRARWGAQTPEGARDVNRLGAVRRRRATQSSPT